MPATARTNPREASAFTLTRTFDAPRDRVWKAWTEPERLKHWWGPKGFNTFSAKVDLKPGGIFHYGMRSPDGQTMWGKFTYREIKAPERLVFIVSFSDESGGVTRHPMAPTWPLETLSTITFAEHGGRTTITVEWMPENATEAERKVFDESHESMRNGWTGTFDQLQEYLAKA